MTDVLDGEGFGIRRAGLADVTFWAGLAGHEEVEPFMAAVSARDEEELREATASRARSRTSTGAS